MTEFEHEKEDRRHEEEDADQAQVKVGRWSPWVWIVPVVAIFLVGYLVVRYGFFGGGDITVRFAEARGLDRYSPVNRSISISSCLSWRTPKFDSQRPLTKSASFAFRGATSH